MAIRITYNHNTRSLSTDVEQIEDDTELYFYVDRRGSASRWAYSKGMDVYCLFDKNHIYKLSRSGIIGIPEDILKRPYVQIQLRFETRHETDRFYTLNILDIPIEREDALC